MARVNGLVQGVGFRFYVRRLARDMGLTGHVCNLPGGRSVEVRAQGERNKLDDLLKLLQIGPRLSRVDRLDVEWVAPDNNEADFEIRF